MVMNTEPLLPGHFFALSPRQGTRLDDLCLAMGALFRESEVSSETLASLTQGMAVIRELVEVDVKPSELNDTVWSGTGQHLPGGIHLLILESPDALRNLTLRLDSNNKPYVGEVEMGGDVPGHFEFSIGHGHDGACLHLRHEDDHRDILLRELGDWTWSPPPAVVRLTGRSESTFAALTQYLTTSDTPPRPVQPERVEPSPSVRAEAHVPPAPPPLPPAPAAAFCQHCGRPMSATARFCGSCGKPRGAKVCARCGHPVANAAAKFCGACGAPVS